VRAQHLDTIRVLLQGRADLFMSSKRGKTSLYMAVKYGSLELVKELVEEGGVDKFHIDESINSWQHSSMLFVAAHCGKKEMVEFLLEKGAKSNRKDDTGLTALHEAAKNGHAEIVEMLLTKGKADVNAEDEHGDTALLFATSQNNLSVMRVLTLNGASTSHQNRSGVSMWNYIMEAEYGFINNVLKLYREAKKLSKDHCIKFTANPNPLLIAIRGSYFDTLELVLRSNVDPHSTDQDGNTFYHVAARKGILGAFSDRFQKFIRLGDTNKYGQTALHLAAKNEQMEVVKILVRKSKKESRNK
jgi:ankyrin repeat protein